MLALYMLSSCLCLWMYVCVCVCVCVSVCLSVRLSYASILSKRPFWDNTGVWQTHTQTDRYTTTAYTALSIASCAKNEIDCALQISKLRTKSAHRKAARESISLRLVGRLFDNDNAWQRGPLWPHRMGPMIHRLVSHSSPEMQVCHSPPSYIHSPLKL